MFAELYRKPERLEQFMQAMAGISAGNFQAFANKFDFSRYKTLCDIGGATGQLSVLVAKAQPHMRCVSVDLLRPRQSRSCRSQPQAWPIGCRRTDRLLRRSTARQPDVITMGMILHDWNLEKKMFLVKTAYDALPAVVHPSRLLQHGSDSPGGTSECSGRIQVGVARTAAVPGGRRTLAGSGLRPASSGRRAHGRRMPSRGRPGRQDDQDDAEGDRVARDQPEQGERPSARACDERSSSVLMPPGPHLFGPGDFLCPPQTPAPDRAGLPGGRAMNMRHRLARRMID